MKKLGIDIGSQYMSAALVETTPGGERVCAHAYREHNGEILETAESFLSDPRFAEYDTLGFTGTAGIDSEHLIDPILAGAEGIKLLLPDSRNVFSVGAESFSLILFDETGEYREHTQNPPCASGTGSFIEQQAGRLGIDVADLARMAESYRGKAPSIATRCAVFAKTDIIHAMQEGYSREAVAAGLCEGIARSIAETLVKGRELSAPAGLVGGVSRNEKIRSALESTLGVPVVVPEHAEAAGAVGAAILGRKDSLDISALLAAERSARKTREPLRLELSAYPDLADFAVEIRDGIEVMTPKIPADLTGGVYLGIDIGSTSTKALLMNRTREIAGGLYTRTKGAPIEAVASILGLARKIFGLEAVPILGTGTTGSGRRLIKEVFDADFDINEITAHAKAAVFLDPEADTIIEIGGQDSKFTRIQDGEVYYSTMNYVCAAGTGSFIEEQAKRLGVPLADFSDLSLGASSPFTSDRCTVYMERDLSELVGEGWDKKALAAAVLNSVRDNYLAKVVNRSPLGDRIVFQGATARNEGLVAAFERLLDKPIYVSPYCHLTGALGAALLAEERGLEGSDAVLSVEIEGIEEEICTRCANRCLLTVFSRGGSKTGWGMKCGQDYAERRPVGRTPSGIIRRFEEAMGMVSAPFPGGAGRSNSGTVTKEVPSLKDRTGKPVIGIPRTLYNRTYGVLWARFLENLGFDVLLHEPKEPIARGKRIVNSDFCAPMIAAHGQIGEILESGADYIFAPAVENEPRESQTEHLFKKKTEDNYFCYYSQYLPVIVDTLTALDLDGRLISPLVSFNSMDNDEIVRTLHAALAEPFPGVKEEAVAAAFTGAYGSYRSALEELEGGYRRSGLDPDASDDIQIVLLGRPYIALDPSVNLGIPEKLEEYGARVFWQDEIDTGDFESVYSRKFTERMHWYYGRRILEIAEFAASKRNLFPVYLTCFRCSPDSFLLSYVKDIMAEYGKPFLVLQLDEHSSDVGYGTRIEAALHSFRTHLDRTRRPAVLGATRAKDDELADTDTVLLPYLDHLISSFWASCFEKAGYRTILLDPDDAALNTGYQYVSGGECMPLVSLLGSVIETVRSLSLEPARCFFYMPTICMACNFPQFPVLSDLAFTQAGLGDIKIGLINNMSPGDILPQSLAIRMLEANIVGGILYKLLYRIKPYETETGASEAVLEKGKERINAAILEGSDLKKVLTEIVEEFRSIERDESDGRKPRIALLGDLYVKFNETVNQGVLDTVQRLGGELVVPSLTEYPFHFYDADIRMFGDNPRHFKLLKTIEKRYEAIARDLLGDQEEPDFARCVELLEEYGIKHYIPGETSINLGRALYAIEEGDVDGILHINPIFCCPGVVTASVYRKIQEDYDIPIIDIFYDGTGNPNTKLIPHLHYLKRKKSTP
jgi:predicted CoA-substrate-specific enzyme activase